MEWNLFDREAEASFSRRQLPHIDMPGSLTFVTFRLVDSMPRAIVQKWHLEIESWLAENGLAGRSVKDVLGSVDVDKRLQSELRRFKQRRWHGHLDACHGSCLLRHVRLRSLVSDALLHFNGERYDLERFVIMPNHVHLLLQMRNGIPLRKQLGSLLTYSARRVNQLLGRSGELWQAEPFDHVVRSVEQFEYLQAYIVDNPRKAQLPEGDYCIWICPSSR